MFSDGRLCAILPSLSGQYDWHDVAIVGERDLANGALPVLLNHFSIEQFPHFRWSEARGILADGASLRYVALRAS